MFLLFLYSWHYRVWLCLALINKVLRDRQKRNSTMAHHFCPTLRRKQLQRRKSGSHVLPDGRSRIPEMMERWAIQNIWWHWLRRTWWKFFSLIEPNSRSIHLVNSRYYHANNTSFRPSPDEYSELQKIY